MFRHRATKQSGESGIEHGSVVGNSSISEANLELAAPKLDKGVANEIMASWSKAMDQVGQLNAVDGAATMAQVLSKNAEFTTVIPGQQQGEQNAVQSLFGLGNIMDLIASHFQNFGTVSSHHMVGNIILDAGSQTIFAKGQGTHNRADLSTEIVGVEYQANLVVEDGAWRISKMEATAKTLVSLPAPGGAGPIAEVEGEAEVEMEPLELDEDIASEVLVGWSSMMDALGGLDQASAEKMMATYVADDAEFVHLSRSRKTEVVSGRGAMLQRLNGRLRSSGIVASHYMITNVMLNERAKRITANGQGTLNRADLSADIESVRYIVDLTVEDGRWKIKRIDMATTTLASAPAPSQKIVHSV